MKVAVTGAAGFIGSHVVKNLLDKGVATVGIDSFTGYYARGIKERNIREASGGRRGFTLIEGDILDTDLGRLLKGVDWVLHLAAQPGVRESFGSQFRTYLKNNVEATERLLRSCVEAGVKGMVFSSSSSVYGEREGVEVEDDPLLPVSPYGVTKMTGEHLCRIYHKTFGLPVVILRLFTVYGPRQRPDMAFHRFIEGILEGKRIAVYGDGSQARDFTYIDDAVRAMVSSMKKELAGEAINVGAGRSCTINEVLAILRSISGRGFDVTFSERVRGDVFKTSASIEKAGELLGYLPLTPLEEGLRRQYESMSKGRRREKGHEIKG